MKLLDLQLGESLRAFEQAPSLGATLVAVYRDIKNSIAEPMSFEPPLRSAGLMRIEPPFTDKPRRRLIGIPLDACVQIADGKLPNTAALGGCDHRNRLAVPIQLRAPTEPIRPLPPR